jgi:hypothetical protein
MAVFSLLTLSSFPPNFTFFLNLRGVSVPNREIFNETLDLFTADLHKEA